MKIKYIVYPIVDNMVQLFLNQLGYQSGYIFEELPNNRYVKKIGSLDIYEGDDFVEKIYFCTTNTPIDLNNIFGNVIAFNGLKAPTWFSVKKIPNGITLLQEQVFDFVVNSKKFNGVVIFFDKKRKAINEKIIESY